jgi:M6 family metalloprotease-like protein
MKNIYRIILLVLPVVLITAINNNTMAAYLENVPVTVSQPDGTKLHCFASGDEYYNWLHDQNNYTIVQNPQNGFYVYAAYSDGELIPTSFIAGKADPYKSGLVAGVNISADRMLALRDNFWKNTPQKPKINGQQIVQNGPQQGTNQGTMNNLVVFIRFSGESEFTDLTSSYDNMFNGTAGTNTMKNYFEEVSNNTLHINTTFYPVAAGAVVKSFEDTHPRSYYQKYNATSNPTGYQNDRTAREQTLLKDAIDAIAPQIPGNVNLDYNNDGYVDNVCFIISGVQEGWSELLWPHRWSLYSTTANINGKRVWDYNFQLRDFLQGSGVGVLAHEMFHSLGSPDLYHYKGNGISPVGGWDVMESTRNPPQHMLTFMKFRYGNWLASIPEITASGTYTLNPTTSTSNTCYKISSPYTLDEYFVVEYRRKQGTFENSVPGSGLIVYRINKLQDGQGNAQGPPDEVYVYRPDGNDSVNGNISNGFFSLGSGRTAINNTTNPRCFLSNLNDGGLNISNVTNAGTTISFTVSIIGFKPSIDFEVSTNNTCIGKKVYLTDLSAAFPNKWQWNITPKTYTFTDGTDSTSKNPVVIFNADGMYSVSLKASNTYGDSILTKQDFITIGTGVALPFVEDFESGQFKLNAWTIENPDSSTTWAITDKASNPDTTAYSAFMFGFEYQVKREKDELVSRNINLSNVNYAKLKFDVSYRRFDNSSFDSLLVYVSNSCGNVYDSVPLYLKYGVNLATGPNKNSNYVPSLNSDWRTDSVDLSNYTGQNIVFKFRSINDYGNNLYLDNINLIGDSLTGFIAEADNSTVCENDTVKFHDKSTGNFTSINWSFPGGNPAVSNSPNPLVVYPAAGNYTATLVKGINGYVKSSSIQIKVNALPAVPTITQNKNVLSTGAANSYQWYDSSGNAIPGETANAFQATKSGKYYVVVKNANGCAAKSALYNFTYVGIREIGQNVSMNVYPNPNNGSFTFNISGNISSPVNLLIQNSLGQTIYSRNDISMVGTYTEKINLKNLAPGIYHIMLTNKEGRSVSRFFVE